MHLIAFARPHDRFGASGIVTGRTSTAWRTSFIKTCPETSPVNFSTHALQAEFQMAHSTTGALPRLKVVYLHEDLFDPSTLLEPH